MVPTTTNSTPAIAAPTNPQGRPLSRCQNQAQKFTTSLPAAPMRFDSDGGRTNNPRGQGYLARIMQLMRGNVRQLWQERRDSRSKSVDDPTGSPAGPKTIGMSLVAFIAARAGAVW